MEHTTPQTATETTGPGAPHWSAAPSKTKERDPAAERERLTRTWLLVLALGVLTLSLLTALVAANQAITIWLQPQYAPFVRFAGAALVAAASLLVVLRLLKRT